MCLRPTIKQTGFVINVAQSLQLSQSLVPFIMESICGGSEKAAIINASIIIVTKKGFLYTGIISYLLESFIIFFKLFKRYTFITLPEFTKYFFICGMCSRKRTKI